MRVQAFVLSALPALVLAMPLFAQAPGRVAVIWQDRGDAAALDLTGGPGGTERGPGTNFTFTKESTSGTSPKFEVQDARGTTWKVKLGEEAKSETAATRLLWAAGYRACTTFAGDYFFGAHFYFVFDNFASRD